MQPASTSTLTLIIADAALETIPNEIANHAAVRNHARRLQQKSSEILLDRSYHHAAMKRLPNNLKRGRPDIVHFSLMEALATPLFIEMKLKVYVHTINDKIITIADNLRIPKSYFRFEGLMTSLFRDNVIKSGEGGILMELSDGTFADLVNIIKPKMVIGLSTVGVESKAQKVAENALSVDHSCIVVGGFAKGRSEEHTSELQSRQYLVCRLLLEKKKKI